MRSNGDPGDVEGGVGAHGEQRLAECRRVAVGDRLQAGEGSELGVEPGDGGVRLADAARLVGARCFVCAFGSFEAGDVPGDRGEFDVALIAGRQRGDLCELLGGGFGAVVAQVTGQGVGV